MCSRAVLAATGSVLTNKYSEGYPGKRYYGGNYVVDQAESLALQRARELFGAEHANVQPHSGANANLAVYLAVLQPGDTVLGMRLDQGGHLTHGSPVNVSGQWYHFVSYGVSESDERIDFQAVADLAERYRPKLIVAGATAYSRIIEPEPFRRIADSVGALLMFDAAHIAGLVAGGAHPNPVPASDIVTLTTHKTLRGLAAAASCPRRRSRRPSTRPFSRGSRAGRSNTSSRRRRSPSTRPRRPSSPSTHIRSSATRGHWQLH